MSSSKLIYNLQSISENKVDGIINLIKSLIFILPALFFLYKFYIKKQKKQFKNIDDINDYINKKEKSSAFSEIIQGIVFIIIGIKIYYFFKPNNLQITVALLIKELKKLKIINNDLYSLLRKYRPSNISLY